MQNDDSHFLIRKSKKDDFGGIKRLEHCCFTSDAFDDELLWQMLDETCDFLTWVAELTSKNILIGYISLYLDAENEGTIVSLCVDPLHRHQGIGTELLQAVINHARNSNFRRLILTVATSNNAAIRLYNKMGFSIRGRIPRYYSSGDDAYVMIKEFKKVQH